MEFGALASKKSLRPRGRPFSQQRPAVPLDSLPPTLPVNRSTSSVPKVGGIFTTRTPSRQATLASALKIHLKEPESARSLRRP